MLRLPRTSCGFWPVVLLVPITVSAGPTLAAALPLASTRPASWNDPQGSWSCLMDWSSVMGSSDHPIDEVAHAALLPTGLHAGKVLLWNFQLSDFTTRSFLFDPLATGCEPSALTTLESSMDANIFCSGHTFLPDGSLLVAGGIPTVAPAGSGYTLTNEKVLRFSPRSLTWVPVASMLRPRFYPTPILLGPTALASQGGLWSTPASSVLVLGGPLSQHVVVGQPLWETLGAVDGNWQGLFPGPDTSGPCGHPWLPAGGGLEYDLVSVPCTDSWFDSYPRGLQLSSGDVFVAGDVDTVLGQKPTATGRTWFARPPGLGEAVDWELHAGPWMGALDSTDPADRHKRHYAPAVLLHETEHKNQVLVFGGANVDLVEEQTLTVIDATDTVEELLFTNAASAPTGAWRAKSPLALPRLYSNAVVLPTGDVLVTGGTDAWMNQNQVEYAPSFAPEIYRIGNGPTAFGSTALMAPPPSYTVAGAEPPTTTPTPRLYHHVALLLPDGRVLVAGGTDVQGFASSKHTAEIFSPPYISQGQRPAVHDSPAQASLSTGEATATFLVKASLPAADVLDRVVLLRPASVTHHFDADQRYIELGFTEVVTSLSQPSNPQQPPIKNVDLNITAPLGSLAPQGWYLLYLVAEKSGSEHRVPSIGQFVQFL